MRARKTTATPASIDIIEWQFLADRFTASATNKKPLSPCAMRCENTQLSIARYAGGCTFNGDRYIFFAPPITGKQNPDGSQMYAWLLVRHDFLLWATKELKRKGEKS